MSPGKPPDQRAVGAGHGIADDDPDLDTAPPEVERRIEGEALWCEQAGIKTKRFCQSPEVIVAHLARSHLELAVAAFRVGMPPDLDVVGRVEKSRVHAFVGADHLLQKCPVTTVAAANEMLSQLPDLPAPDPWFAWHSGQSLIVRIAAGGQQYVYLANRKTGQGKINVEVQGRQVCQFDPQDVQIPPGAQGNLVISQTKSALLCLRQSRQRDRWHLAEAEFPGSAETAMTSDDDAIRVDQNRVGESELADRSNNLFDLGFGMGPRVSRIGL